MYARVEKWPSPNTQLRNSKDSSLELSMFLSQGNLHYFSNSLRNQIKKVFLIFLKKISIMKIMDRLVNKQNGLNSDKHCVSNYCWMSFINALEELYKYLIGYLTFINNTQQFRITTVSVKKTHIENSFQNARKIIKKLTRK